MKVLEYLRAGNTVQSLTEKYAISVKPHQKYPNLVLLKYDMIDSPMAEPIVQECRGLILDIGSPGKFTVVSRSFNKFFNHGEGHAATIDWNTARTFTKEDGSLAVLYWYDGEWHVQTSGTPDASGEVQGFGFTFKELFWKTWNELGYELPLTNDYCHIFELCTKYNKVIVQHEAPRIVYLGSRVLCESECESTEGDIHKPFEEFFVPTVNDWHKWEVVKSFPLNTIEGILASCNKMDPSKQEGYVVCDAHFNRIKIKNPQYVALNHMRDGMGPKAMIEMIRVNEKDEFLAYFPEFREDYEKYKVKYNSLIAKLEAIYYLNKDIVNQKEFALAIGNVAFSGALFQLRAGKIKSVREYLSKINIDNLVQYMKD